MLGQTVGGRYQILTQLGRGGFGTTFVAQDMQRPGNPQCVVKQFKPLANDPYTLNAAKRFFDLEAAILEMLGKHDQIPQLLAHFAENEEFFLVQEFIPGHDLKQELPPYSDKLTESAVIQLLKDILAVLAFVHQNHVIHRDIKPENIRRRESDGKIVLIDFGAVKQVSTQMTSTSGQTSFTVAIGTPGYMPSEQANSNPHLSSDIYAVGIIAILALTGINPAAGSHSLPRNPATGEIDWRNKVKVSPQFASILDKMVRYDFRQRYPTAESVLQALEMLDKAPLTKLQQSLPKRFVMGLGITVAVAVGVIILSQLKINTTNFLNYAAQGVKINYPENWSVQATPNAVTQDIVTFLSPKQSDADQFPEILTIRVEPLSSTLDESKDLFIREVKNTIDDAQIESSHETTLANKRANQLVFTGKSDTGRLKSLQVWTLQNDNAYIITYTANLEDYQKFLPIVEKMIQSFVIE
ncbi:TPR repeat-containing serine/threonine protein kinase [Anabaenopsis circularis NIES-21]|uniref:non-specific serine/threonine protein kinase n=2 Tax=Nostocales TaxID=1161 RepID=A0A1Z4GLE4_9CYAN|nr:serine/threonine-protein kinase [Nostoc cycadae]BAY18166.1 TPR repeat-containing serine/threonine protein kinase [Anabaenopsis circularis NIES-21]GBE93149.1 serine/threonine protein kinase [Nostoc cycadae WK-1]